LFRQGAYTRGIARRSIRRRKRGKSFPGTPPFTHTGALKRSILFGVSRNIPSVVIGPSKSEIGLIGRTHEFGGTENKAKGQRGKVNWKLRIGGHGPIPIRGRGTGGRKTKTLSGAGRVIFTKLRTQRQVNRAKVTAAQHFATQKGKEQIPIAKKRRYPPRPFMGPALEKAAPGLPQFWHGAIRA